MGLWSFISSYLFGNNSTDSDDDESSEDEINPVESIQKSYRLLENAKKKHYGGIKSEDDSLPPPCSRTGVVTQYTDQHGVIKGCVDRRYHFSSFNVILPNDITVGTKVDFEAEWSEQMVQWEITKMEVCRSSKHKQIIALNQELSSRKTVTVRILTVCDGMVSLQWEENGQVHSEDIEWHGLGDLIEPKFKLRPGDLVNMMMKKTNASNSPDIEDYDSCVDILKITPMRVDTIVGEVMKFKQVLTINKTIVFTEDVIEGARSPRIGEKVLCTAIECDQNFGNVSFGWRAIKVIPCRLNNAAAEIASSAKSSWPIENDVDEWMENCLMRCQDPVQPELEDLFSNKYGVEVLPKEIIFPKVAQGTSIEKEISVKNFSESAVQLMQIRPSSFDALCKIEMVPSCKEKKTPPWCIETNQTLKFNVTVIPGLIGRTEERWLFVFESFIICRSFKIYCVPAINAVIINLRDLSSKHLLNSAKKRNAEIAAEKSRKPNRKVDSSFRSAFFREKLVARNIPKGIQRAYENQSEDQLYMDYPELFTVSEESGEYVINNLNFDIYETKFKVALWLEELHEMERRRQYDIEEAILFSDVGGYTLHVPNMRDIEPPLHLNCLVEVYDLLAKSDVYTGKIIGIFDSKILIKFLDIFDRAYKESPVHVHFKDSRTVFIRMHHAIHKAKFFLEERILFPSMVVVNQTRVNFYETEEPEEDNDDYIKMKITSKYHRKTQEPLLSKEVIPQGQTRKKSVFAKEMKIPELPQALQGAVDAIALRWFNKSLNDEQKRAVKCILKGQARPLPYIIFGPPGTGKTITVVEAIIQINKLDPSSRILVITPTNSAADIIAEYLVYSGQFQPGDFVRMNGYLRGHPPEIISLFCSDGSSIQSLMFNRILISTCSTSGQFLEVSLPDGHFSHVILDEAGYCSEPEAMISAVLSAAKKGAQMIMAGDPKQLGPIIKSNAARALGLEMSFLERLMKFPIYSRNEEKFPETKYDPLLVTKLVKTYRSHPEMLTVPNQLFYHNELEGFGNPEIVESLSKNKEMNETVLAAKGIPIVFHGVRGVHELKGTGFYNIQEAGQVLSYVHDVIRCGVSPDNIGVITPYREQVKLIRKMLEGLDFLELPKVGTVEEFQGSEKQVIIASTVKTGDSQLIPKELWHRHDFLFSEKRFNVAVTRAQALMIMIGDPYFLIGSKCWKTYLMHCVQLGAYKGCALPLEMDYIFRETVDLVRKKLKT